MRVIWLLKLACRLTGQVSREVVYLAALIVRLARVHTASLRMESPRKWVLLRGSSQNKTQRRKEMLSTKNFKTKS